jgi:uncharacterized protein YjdB
MTARSFRQQSRAAAALLILAAAGCRDGLRPDAPSEIRVDVAAPTVAVGDSVHLAATVRTASGQALTTAAIAWSSSDTTVAAVDSLGWLRARAVGNVTVQASVEGLSGTASLTVVYPPVAAIVVTPNGYTVGMVRTMQLAALVLDAAGREIRGIPVRWSSSLPDTVSVDSTGKVRANHVGEVEIRASAGGKVGTAVVFGGQRVNDIRLDPLGDVVLAPGESRQLRVRLTEDTFGFGPSAVTVLRQVTWSTADPKIATFTPDGVIHAVGLGTTTLRVVSEEMPFTATVEVLGRVASVALNPDTTRVPTGTTLHLQAVARDSAGTSLRDPKFTWTSSDPAVARVETAAPYDLRVWRATVSTRSPGSAYIVATVDGVADTTRVTVVPPVASVAVQPAEATLQVGSTRQLTAVLRDAAGQPATERPVSWSTSALGVASVSPLGLVTALSPGVTTITASSEGTEGTARITVGGSTAAAGDWASIAAGDGHTCAITRGGAAYCWGRNLYGEVGSGSTDSTGVPTAVGGGLRFSRLSTVSTGTCGITPAGEGYCWGSPYMTYSQVVTSPRRVAPGRTLLTVHAGGTYGQACGVEATGNGYCWGFWHSDIWQDSTMPGSFRDFVASVPCGLATDGRVLCWSQRHWTPVPSPLSDAHSVGIAGAQRYICLWDAQGATTCTTSVGRGVGGSQGFGGFASVAASLRFVQVSAGTDRACGLTADGQAYCWPVAFDLDLRGTVEFGAPSPAAEGLRFTQISAGGGHACGVTTGGAAYCWGSNQWGQLGVGIIGGSSSAPSRVQEPS